MIIEEYSYASRKICWMTLQELQTKINSISMTKLISCRATTPDSTDTRNWSQIYYEYRVR